MKLRPYQQQMVDDTRAAFAAGARAPLVVAPTGAGKTIFFSFVARNASARNARVLVLCHRRELIRQAARKLEETGVPHGVVAPGFTATRDLVQVGSVQTLARRLDRLAPPDLIVIDEAHHAVAGQWSQVLAHFPQARILGVTATPERLDGRGLGITAGGPFDTMVQGPTVMDLQEGGFLCRTRVYAPADAPDLSGVGTRGGDYEAGALAAAMQRVAIVGDAIAHYARHAPGQPAILFSPSVAHAAAMADAFRAAGWRAATASGATPGPERDAAIAGLATGAVQVLCSCDLISEGLDVPAVGCVILMRPTKSLGLYLQQVGRGLRPAPGKEHLVVLDHAGNSVTHGLIEEPRAWSLDGRPKKEKPPATRQCRECFAIHAPAPRCPACGFAPPAATTPREGPEHVAGDLAEVQVAERLAKFRQGRLEDVLREATPRDLKDIARARGYAPGWVFHARRELRQRQGAAA